MEILFCTQEDQVIVLGTKIAGTEILGLALIQIEVDKDTTIYKAIDLDTYMKHRNYIEEVLRTIGIEALCDTTELNYYPDNDTNLAPEIVVTLLTWKKSPGLEQDNITMQTIISIRKEV